jgi:hypothetical protein
MSIVLFYFYLFLFVVFKYLKRWKKTVRLNYIKIDLKLIMTV